MARWLCAVAALTVAVEAGAAGWERGYSPRGGVDAVVALPAGRLAVLAESTRTLLVAGADGEVIAARKLQLDAYTIAAGPKGEVFTLGFDLGSGIPAIGVTKFREGLAVEWSRTIDASYVTPPTAAAGTRDGGLVFIERGNIVKLAGDGSVQWAITLDPSDVESLHSIRETGDGGFVLAGSSRRSPWLVRLLPDGKFHWQRTITMRGAFIDAVEVKGGGFVAVGGQESAPMIVVRLDARGNTLWARTSRSKRDAVGVVTVGDGYAVLSRAYEPMATALTFLRGDGSVAWQRSMKVSGHGLTSTDARRLASAGGGVFVASHSLIKVGGDGDAGCTPFSPMAEDFAPLKLVGEELSLDVRPAQVKSREAKFGATPITLSAAANRCAVGEPVAAVAPAPQAPPKGDVRQRVLALFARKDFAALDALAADLRTPDRSGDPAKPWGLLRLFYETLQAPEAGNEADRLARLREWRTLRKDSITAGIALADTLHTAAWRRRGDGLSDTVTAAGAAEYDQLLEESRKVLDAVGPAGEQDVLYWRLRIDFAPQLGLGDVREIARRALARHHDPQLAQIAAFYLFTKWGGSPDIYLQFADEAARLTKATYGDGVYAWVVYQARYGDKGDFEAMKPNVDWNRVRAGHEALIKLSPKWAPTYHRYAVMARWFDDRATARRLFEKPELAWYDGAQSMWRQDSFPQVREWALGTPALPGVERKPSSEWPRILLESELRVGGSVHNELAAFLVETANGVLAVSAVPQRTGASGRENRIGEVAQAFVSWTMASLKAASLVTPQPANHQLGVAMTLAPRTGEWPVVRLKASRASNLAGGTRLLVVGCAWSAGRCTQQVYEGRLLSVIESGGLRLFNVVIPAPIDPKTLRGGAILDEDRNVVAVVTDRGSTHSAGGTVVEADGLTAVLPAP